MSPPFLLSPRDLGFERAQLRLPEGTKAVEPRVYGLQWLDVDRIDATWSVDAHAGETGVSQNPEMLRDGGLGDAELFLDDLDDVARTMLAFGEQLQNAASNRIAENIESVHSAHLRFHAGVERRRQFRRRLRVHRVLSRCNRRPPPVFTDTRDERSTFG